MLRGCCSLCRQPSTIPAVSRFRVPTPPRPPPQAPMTWLPSCLGPFIVLAITLSRRPPRCWPRTERVTHSSGHRGACSQAPGRPGKLPRRHHRPSCCEARPRQLSAPGSPRPPLVPNRPPRDLVLPSPHRHLLLRRKEVLARRPESWAGGWVGGRPGPPARRERQMLSAGVWGLWRLHQGTDPRDGGGTSCFQPADGVTAS